MEFNLEGAAADWFRWMSRNGLITTWARFEKSVKNRFGSSKYEDPRGSLSKLLQLGTVEDYQREFEKLMNRVTDIPDSLRISFYISRLKLNLQHEMLVSSPTTLGDAFSIARITEARFEATAEKERYIKEKAYTTLTLPSEEASPVVKGPLYASEDTLQSLRSEDPNFKIQEKAIEYVRALNAAPLEVVFVGLVDEVRGKFAEFSEDKGCVERNVTPWAADGGRRKRVKCYVQGSERRKMKKVLVAAAEGATLCGCSTFRTPSLDLGVKVGSIPLESSYWLFLYGNRSPFVHTGSVPVYSPWNCIFKDSILCPKIINLLALFEKAMWEMVQHSLVGNIVDKKTPRGGWKKSSFTLLVELVGSISFTPSNDRWASAS
ncbi:ty3-gypsy retrotransposon protein [Tanacetum coccineum]